MKRTWGILSSIIINLFAYPPPMKLVLSIIYLSTTHLPLPFLPIELVKGSKSFIMNACIDAHQCTNNVYNSPCP